MKSIQLTLFLVFVAALNSTAQIINIPDPVLKTELTTTNCVHVNGVATRSVDTNGDGDVQLSEALAVIDLRLSDGQVTDFSGLEAFTNLEIISFGYFQGSSSWPISFNLNTLTQLKQIDAYIFPLENLNVEQLQQLEVLSFYNLNGISNLELSNSTQLKTFEIFNGGGSISSLDFSNCPDLETLRLSASMNDLSLNLKNGTDLTLLDLGMYSGYICVDPTEEQLVLSALSSNSSTVVNPYCYFTPGGDFNELNGLTRFNTVGNCTTSDPLLSSMSYSYTDGTLTGAVYTNTGSYNIYLPDGQYVITPQMENPTYWNITPPNFSLNFPTQSSPITQDFCVSANGSIEDLEVMIFEMSEPRPGFEVDYRVVVRN
jgi:hypothetical protein